MESIFITTVIDVGAGRTVPAVAPKKPGGSTELLRSVLGCAHASGTADRGLVFECVPC